MATNKWGERGELVTLTITTRLPAKWLIVDRETGAQYEWRGGRWTRIEPTTARGE